MSGKLKSALYNAGQDLKAGTAALTSLFWRVSRAAFAIFGGNVKKSALSLPKPKGYLKLGAAVFRASGSAFIWLLMAALAVNIRFASNVLPQAEVDLWSVNRPPNITVFDREGNRIGSRGSLYGDPVALDSLPPYVIDAFIATEDRRFFEHHGFDLRGLARAVVANIQAGSVVEGGSTITQQLAKNLFLEYDRTLTRKLEEIQLALWLEARLSKDEILSLYLNRIYLGGGAYGIDAAANAYFSKSAAELTVAEAALLAGLPKAPSNLAPTINMDGAVRRSHEVIDNLIEAKKLDKVTAEVAKLNPPDLNLQVQNNSYGYFLDYVLAELESRFGVLTDDLLVTATLDSDLQFKANEAIHQGIDAEAFVRGAEQAALIAFDKQGGIVAMVGGLDYNESQFNRSSQAKRQPGSAFKPFVFLAALEAGLTPESVVIDQPIRVDTWEPRNYLGKHSGPMRLSTAVAKSVNSVAVQVTEFIGRDRVIDAAKRAGISEQLDSHPSLALGSLELSLEGLTAAYMPFAHDGAEIPPHAIQTVRTRRGDVLYEFKPIEGFYVIDTELAHQTTQMLMQVISGGTGRGAKLDNWQVAGKTGTTNDWRDAWFVGYTSELTTGVWVGNDRSAPMREVTGGTIPLHIWREFMVEAHEGLEPSPLFEGAASTLEDVTRLRAFYEELRANLLDTAYPPAQISSWEEYLSQDQQRQERSQNRGWRLRRQDRSEGVRGRAAPGIENRETE